MIDGNELVRFIEERKKLASELRGFDFDGAERELDIVIAKIKTMQEGSVVDEINVFDKCEVHENCTVQILSNSTTGEVSIGWWQETQEEIRRG